MIYHVYQGTISTCWLMLLVNRAMTKQLLWFSFLHLKNTKILEVNLFAFAYRLFHEEDKFQFQTPFAS